MKLFYTLILAIFLLPFYANSQTNYKSGLVITNAGETINGFINYKEWYSNPNNISFKKTSTDKAKTYSPADISYFEITGFEAYQSATVSISLGKTDIQTVKGEIDTASKTAQVFLKVIKKGSNISLLSYTDAIKTRFYIADNKDGGIPHELKYQPYLDAGSNTLKKKNLYYAQLIDLAHKYRPDNADKIIERIVVVDYTETEIAKVVNLINNDTDAKKDQNKARPFTLFAGIGVNASQTKRADDAPAATVDVEKAYYLPELTLGIDAPFNPNTGALVFRAELSLNMTKAHITNFRSEFSAATQLTYAFTQSSTSLRPQLIYNFYNGKSFKFYAGAGVAINLSVYTNASEAKLVVSPTVAGYNTYEVEKIASSNKLWFNPMAKAGFIINNKFDIAFAYQAPSRIDDAAHLLNVKTTTVEAGINYRF